VLGWGRAILMQLAHPLIAAAVHEHSSVRRGAYQQVERLYRTIRAMLDLVAGDRAAATRAAAAINGIHARVHGTLGHAAGRFPGGAAYDATDPELLLWVHATLTVTLPDTYELLVAPLPTGARDRYCRNAALGSALVGLAPERCPQSTAALQDYVGRTIGDGTLAVTPAAREIATVLLHPPLAISPWPVGRIHRLVTIGTLPEALRRQYGLAFYEDDRRALDRWARRARRVRRWLPDGLALWPAMRRETDDDHAECRKKNAESECSVDQDAGLSTGRSTDRH
jgi:uncharacterized protein (DUF2236 family)